MLMAMGALLLLAVYVLPVFGLVVALILFSIRRLRFAALYAALIPLGFSAGFLLNTFLQEAFWTVRSTQDNAWWPVLLALGILGMCLVGGSIAGAVLAFWANRQLGWNMKLLRSS